MNIIPLLLLLGTFTFIPSFGQNNNIDWNQICNTVAIALYHSCDIYVNSFGQLTYEGERAIGCIRNGLALGGGAAALGTPLEMIIPGLDILAGMTGCDGIVKLDLLSSLGNPNQILNMLTQTGVNNNVPQNNLYESNNLNNFKQNTIPHVPQDEFLIFNNELFSVKYPSNWEYREKRYLGEPSVYFQDKNNLSGDIVLIGTYKVEVKDLDELILHIKNPQSTLNLINKTEIQITDINEEHIYLGKYPAVKFTATVNSESIPFQKFTEYATFANDKLYAIMLYSNPTYPPETNHIFTKMVSSFDIFPIPTTNSSSEYSTFISDTYKIQFEYPIDWKVKEKTSRFDEDRSITVSGPSIESIFVNTLNIGYSPSFSRQDLEIAMNKAVSAYTSPELDSDVDVRLIEGPSYVYIDNLIAGTFLYTINIQNSSYKDAYQLWILKPPGDLLYTIKFLSTSYKFDSRDITEIRDHFIKSIKFQN